MYHHSKSQQATSLPILLVFALCDDRDESQPHFRSYTTLSQVCKSLTGKAVGGTDLRCQPTMYALLMHTPLLHLPCSHFLEAFTFMLPCCRSYHACHSMPTRVVACVLNVWLHNQPMHNQPVRTTQIQAGLRQDMVLRHRVHSGCWTCLAFQAVLNSFSM